MNKEIPHSGTYDSSDGLYAIWLGKDVNRLFKNRTTIYKKVFIGQIYDDCDVPLNRK